jgi:hypothetical protein
MINERIEKVDIRWSQVGDFILKSGDIEDSSKNFGEAFIQEVRTRISNAIGTWKTNPIIGSNIDEFEGQPNTPLTGQRLQADATFALTKDGYLNINEFEITPVPIAETQILMRIQFRGILTERLPDSKIILNIIFDLTGKGPFIVN